MENKQPFARKLIDNPWILLSVLFFILFIASLVFDFKSEARVFYARIFAPEMLDSLYENDSEETADIYDPSIAVEVSTDDDPSLGSEEAPVVMVEFSDFACPYCGRYHETTFPSIKEQYIDQGKVKYVFRDYPLPMHENAAGLAVAANCAGKQDKYWEMSNYIFTNQSSVTEEVLDSYAGELGLDLELFEKCKKDEQLLKEVEKDLTDGESYGVSGTPSFFINGVMISGAYDFAVFSELIEEALKNS